MRVSIHLHFELLISAASQSAVRTVRCETEAGNGKLTVNGYASLWPARWRRHSAICQFLAASDQALPVSVFRAGLMPIVRQIYNPTRSAYQARMNRN